MNNFSILLNQIQEKFRTLQKPSLLQKKAFEEFFLQKESFFFFFPKTFSLDSSLLQTTEQLSSYASFLHPECKTSHLVLEDETLSSQEANLKMLPWKEASKLHEVFLHNRSLFLLGKKFQNPFYLLSQVFQEDGIFLEIPDNTPPFSLQILQLISCKTKNSFFPRIQISLGKNTFLTLFFSTISLENAVSFWNNPIIDCILGENAHLKLFSSFENTSLGLQTPSFVASLQKNSTLEHSFASPSIFSQNHHHHVFLEGEQASASSYGLYSLKNTDRFFLSTNFLHQAKNSHSQQLFKGMLKDQSISHFQGRLFLEKETFGSSCKQHCHHLLLSNQAIAKTFPSLDIFCSDVQASHGATIAQLDEEELFYLKSRGLSEEESLSLLEQSFFHDLLEKIPKFFKKHFQRESL